MTYLHSTGQSKERRGNWPEHVRQVSHHLTTVVVAGRRVVSVIFGNALSADHVHSCSSNGNVSGNRMSPREGQRGGAIPILKRGMLATIANLTGQAIATLK